jgi:hypothetical protein
MNARKREIEIGRSNFFLRDQQNQPTAPRGGRPAAAIVGFRYVIGGIGNLEAGAARRYIPQLDDAALARSNAPRAPEMAMRATCRIS